MTQPAGDQQLAAVIDLLGVLAYGELTAFDRMAHDARMAPTTALRAALAEKAALEMGHYRRLVDRLTELGADPQQAMAPFVEALETFHARTEPHNWGEALVKAYVGDGLAADFYRQVANLLDQPTRELVTEVLADWGNAELAIREVAALTARDATAESRLSLWGRRLVGEAISQAQHVAAQRDALVGLIVAGGGGLASISALTEAIMARHVERMGAIGLAC